MHKFSFYMHDGPTTTPSCETEEFATREAALAHGRALLIARPRYVAVIIGEGDDELACLTRAELAAPATRSPGLQNRLLRALTGDDLDLLQSALEPVTLALNFELAPANRAVEDVYFLEAGLACVVATTVDGVALEVGLFGRDGMSGASILLGVDQTPNRSFIQVEGSGHRLKAAALLGLLRRSPTLGPSLLKFVHVLSFQADHTAVANGAYDINQRLSRALLMAHDRLDGDTLQLTHDALAIKLAVRRSGVTVATHVLEGDGIIRARRGRITILDRLRLEQVAAGSYGAPEAEYARLIGPLNAPGAQTSVSAFLDAAPAG